MPVPKRKRSKSRRDSRHANWGIKVKAITKCTGTTESGNPCAQPLATHQACKECGYYKGAKVLRTKDDRARERGASKKVKEAARAEKESQKNQESAS